MPGQYVAGKSKVGMRTHEDDDPCLEGHHGLLFFLDEGCTLFVDILCLIEGGGLLVARLRASRYSRFFLRHAGTHFSVDQKESEASFATGKALLLYTVDESGWENEIRETGRASNERRWNRD